MLRTVSIPTKLESERFLSLLKQGAEIFNVHINWALENRTYNKSRVQHALYTQLRHLYLKLPSVFIQSIGDTALEAVKATKFERRHQQSRYLSSLYCLKLGRAGCCQSAQCDGLRFSCKPPGLSR
jgi:hypothetical protein